MAVDQIHKRITFCVSVVLQVSKILDKLTDTDLFICKQIYQIQIKGIIHDRIPFISSRKSPA